MQRQIDLHFKKQRKEQRQTSNLGGGSGIKARGGAEKPSYKQYFESDEDMEDESNERVKVNGRKSAREGDSEFESGDQEESEEEDDREWEERCYICNKQLGTLICCETCPHVVHPVCVGLKKTPEGDWHCEDCLVKQVQRRTTRGITNQQQKIASKGAQKTK